MPRTIHIGILLLLLLGGCKKENDFERLQKDEWSPSVAAPLIDTRTSLERILAESDGQLNTNDEGTIVLRYSSRILSFNGKDLIELTEMAAELLDSSKILQIPSLQGRKLETLILKGGELEYQFDNPDTNELILEIELPFATQNGMPFEQTIVVPPGGYSSGSFDLSGYEFDLTLGGSAVNSMQILQTVTDAVTGQNLTGDHPLKLQFRNLLFSYVDGYLGQFDFGISSDTIPMRFFRQWEKGSVEFTDPQVQLSIENSFGFPITGDLTTVEAFSGKEGAKEDLDPQNAVQDSFAVDFPGLSGVGGSRNTSFTFHKGNSDLGSMISIFPTGIRSDLSLQANSEGDSSQFNFLLDDSELTADMVLTLPMEGRLDNVQLRDTIAMALDAQDRFDGLKSARFKLLTENGLPSELGVQIFLADGEGQLLDSLIQGGRHILSAAEPLPEGSTASRESHTRIEYDRSQDADLSRTEELILEVGLRTFNEGKDTVAFKADQELRIRLGMIAETEMGS